MTRGDPAGSRFQSMKLPPPLHRLAIAAMNALSQRTELQWRRFEPIHVTKHTRSGSKIHPRSAWLTARQTQSNRGIPITHPAKRTSMLNGSNFPDSTVISNVVLGRRVVLSKVFYNPNTHPLLSRCWDLAGARRSQNRLLQGCRCPETTDSASGWQGSLPESAPVLSASRCSRCCCSSLLRAGLDQQGHHIHHGADHLRKTRMWWNR